jgi:alkylation response protein AidB-like acyl-CoA dehydrogenase
MDFDFSPDQYTLRDEARRFLEQQCPTSHVREFIDDPAGWSRDLWKQMADLGWMSLPFPEEVGGLGQSFLDLVLLLGELGAAVAPVPFLSSIGMAGQVILRHGSESQRERYLPGIASGERIATVGVAERAGSYDSAGISTRASADGHAWRLTGEKRYVLDAPAADLFVVAARGPDGVRWFVVEEGATVTTQRAYDLSRSIGAVALDGVRADPLEAEGLEPGLRTCVAALCAEMVGTAGRILDLSVSYAKEREQFGRPIGSFQAIKHKCAEMLTDLESSRSAAFYACWAAATDAPDADLAVAVAKSYCSDALARLGGEGVQVHGGIAFTWEHDMHLYLKRIKSAEALFGDAAFHRERIAQLVGL